MKNIKGGLKVIYIFLLTLCVILGMVLEILTYIPFPKGQWFDVLFDVCIICTLILTIPLLIFIIKYLILKRKK